MKRQLQAIWLTALLLAVVTAGTVPLSLAKYAATGKGGGPARIAEFDPKWVKSGRMQEKGVGYSVPGLSGGTGVWQLVGLHNNSEVMVDFNLWVTVSDSDTAPAATGTKWRWWYPLLRNPEEMVQSDLSGPVTVFANIDQELLAKNKNGAANNDNETLWTVRVGPGKYAFVQLYFDIILDAPRSDDNGNAVGGRCHLWYQAVQVD